MVYFYTFELFLLFVTYVTYIQIRHWLRWSLLEKWRLEKECGVVQRIPNHLPWGFERTAKLIVALRRGGVDFLEDVLRSQFKNLKCHTFRIHGLFNSSVIVTADPQNIQAVLATKFQDFDLGSLRKDNFYDVLGNGIFTAEREAWIHYRHQLKPQFTRDQVSDLESAARHLDILFNALPKENTSGWVSETNLQPFLYNFTLDASTEFLFGNSVNSQTASINPNKSTEQKENVDFADAMNYAQEYLSMRIRLKSLYWLANSKRFRWACKTVREYADKFVQVALEQKEKPSSKEPGKFVLLDALIEETQNPIELRDQVLQVLLAGRDTTAALLSWTLLLLSRHPNELQKLRSAIISHFGTSSAPKSELSFQTLKACKELTYVLYEVLRLYPIVPINGRVAVRDTILPVGGGKNHDEPIAVMKGELVGYSAYAMQRRHDIFGEDADEFVPGRWEGRKLGWEWIPFSGGPRVCLGQQYALNEASFVIVRFLQRFDKIEAVEMEKPLKKSVSITLSPADGVKIRLHKSQD